MYAHKLAISLLLCLFAVAVHARTPKTEILKSEELESTTPAIETLRHLIRLKKHVDDNLIKAVQENVSNESIDGGSSSTTTSSTTTSGSSWMSSLGSSIGSMINSDDSTANSNNSSSPEVDQEMTSLTKNTQVYEQKENENKDLLYTNKLDTMTKETDLGPESNETSNDHSSSTTTPPAELQTTSDLSMVSTTSDTEMNKTISESSTTSPDQSKIINALTDSTNQQRDASNDGKMDAKQINSETYHDQANNTAISLKMSSYVIGLTFVSTLLFI